MSFKLDLDRPIVSFDLETTGLNTAKDQIVDIGMIKLMPDGTRTVHSMRLKPLIPIEPDAAAIHGITDEMVADCQSFAEAASTLFNIFSGCDVTGYNLIAFDVPLLTAEFQRCRIVWPESGIKIVDTLSVFKVQEPHNLVRALAYYRGRDLGESAHEATADAEAALDVLLGQGKHYKSKTVDELIALSVRPDWVDSTGKVKWVNGVPTINFGKWAGNPLTKVPRRYFDWVLRQDFPEDFKCICRDACNNIYPDPLEA